MFDAPLLGVGIICVRTLELGCFCKRLLANINSSSSRRVSAVDRDHGLVACVHQARLLQVRLAKVVHGMNFGIRLF